MSRNFIKEIAFNARQYSKEKEYWMNQLSGDLVKSMFPYDFNKTPGDSGKGKMHRPGTVEFKISDELFEKLIRTINNSDLRLFMIMVTGLQLLLSRYTGYEDIIVGASIEKQDIEGDFLNTVLALRTRFTRNMTFKELLMQVRQTIIAASKHQNYPIETIYLELNIENRETDDFPLFDIAILLKNIHDKSYINHININMIFSFLRTRECIEGEVEYNSSLYTGETIRRIINHFINLLKEALKNVDAPLGSMGFMSEKERQHLLMEINDTREDYPESTTIHELFEVQAGETPGNIAVEEADTGRSISYKKLNERANQLAGLLIEKGAAPGTVMAMIGERTLDIVTSILAILKIGGVFLPLDAQNPDERIHFILNDSGAYLFLTQKHIIEQRPGIFPGFSPGTIIAMDDESLYRGNAKNPGIHTKPMDLAYIIYTSGTTGKPKGVIVEHRSLVNYIHFAKNNYVKNQSVNFPFYTSIAFDLTITSIFTPLVTGNAVVVYSGWNKGNLIERIVDDNKVGVVKLTPSHLHLIRDKKVGANGSGIKRFIVGGETLMVQIVRDIHDNFGGNVEIYNEYGPTEATVGCMLYKFDPRQDEGKGSSVSIGLPAANIQIYLLGKYLDPVPVGAVGEIYVSGKGLARGYLNRPELTAHKFQIPNKSWYYRSFGSYKSYIIYRTGDLARWRSDGNIDFLGRIDQQVKIRGFRIELEEIESLLLKHRDIKEAVVVIKDYSQRKGTLQRVPAASGDNEQFICAYYVSDQENELELKEYLSTVLPDYMIPLHFVRLDRIPLTVNGKVDKKALPEPEIETGDQYTAPRNETERKLSDVWWELLGIDKEKIGIDSSFFQLGGHSLSATILATKIHKEFNVKLQLVDIFRYTTIRELAELLKGAVQELFVPIEPVEKKEYYALSSAQKRFFVLHRMDPASTAYNIPLFVMLEGRLDRAKFEETFRKLVDRHESLRTHIELIGDEPLQWVSHQVTTGIEFHETGGAKPADKEKKPGEIEKIIGDFARPFNLSQAPMIRMGLIRAAEEQHILMIDIHHIVSDLLSMDVIVRDFIALYAGEDLPALRIQYKDYARWQNSEKEKQTVKKQEEFWLKEFAGEIPILNLPTDFPRPMIQRFDGGEFGFEIGKNETLQLNRLASANGATMFMVILAICNILLAKLSNQDDIVMGSPAAGRGHADLEPILGLFINTLALRNFPTGEKTFIAFLNELKKRSVAAFENQHYPFEDLVEKIAVNRDVSRNPLFDVLFVWNYAEISDRQIPGLKAKSYDVENKTAKFDLNLGGSETGDQVTFLLEYSTRLFKEVTIQRFSKYFKKIISSVIENPQKKISGIEIISEEEKKQIITHFNDTQTDYPGDKAVHRLFEERVEQNPDYIALIGGGTRFIASDSRNQAVHLTYRQLNQKANQLAEVLKEKGVMVNDIVAIMLERSIEMIVSIFAILKIGAAYLPIETDHPGERIAYILQDSTVRLLLSKKKFVPHLAAAVEWMDLEDLERISEGRDKDNIHEIVTPDDLAYVLYTSGSTGEPKGVIVEHGPVVNILFTLFDSYPLLENDVYLMKTPYVFDVSVSEIFGWYLQAGRLVLLENEGEKDPHKIFNTTICEGVTHINFVPSMFGAFLDFMESQGISDLGGLKYIFLAGEALPPGMVKKYKAKDNNVLLENIYGPTEATIYASQYSLQHWDGTNDSRIPIGKPLNNIELYVVDSGNHLQPVGIPGELCIAGVGLARGYLNRPELTAERFLEGTRGLAPLSNYDTIYRTGDLARWLPDGNIEFFGRMDQQVKVRGFRIELGEIETFLQKHEKIKEAVVISTGDQKGNNDLAAYFVPDKANISEVPGNQAAFNPDAGDLREFLLKGLPHYMVPSYFVQLEVFPLTTSGKVDRKALPDPIGTALGSGFEYMGARNRLEKKLVETWASVLGRSNISVQDDFFMIGGDSIKAIQIAARMNSQGYRLHMQDIFRFSSIAKLAPRIKKVKRIPAQSVITGTLPLTPIQKWFFEIDSTDLHHFNHAVMLYSKEVLEEEGIKAVFHKIQEHHDGLRMTFNEVDGEMIQTNHGLDYPFSMEVVDSRNTDREKAIKALEDKANEIQASINLEKGPLMKLALFHLDDGDRLLIVIHHLVIDGVSWRILFEDIESLYRQYKHREPFALPLKTDSFKLWSEKLAAYANSPQLLKGKTYWAQLESAAGQPLKKDFQEENNYMEDSESLSCHFSEEETTNLVTKVNHAFGTEINDILLTALALAIKRTWGNPRVLIALEGHGREDIGEDIDINRTIGWFTSIYPVLLDISHENDLSRQVKEIKENLRRVPGKGIGYGILKYLTVKTQKEDIDFRLNPQVNFNYLGQVDADLEQTSFQGTAESAGEVISINRQRAYEIEVSGIIFDKQLELSVVFNKKQYRRETIETLLEQYKAALGHIISYCSARKQREFTPSDFPVLTYKELSIEKLDQLARQYPLEDLYPLSPLQAGILLHTLNNKETSTYFIQVSYHIHGELHIGSVEKSLNELCKHHEILRTAFVHEGLERPLQLVLENRKVDFYNEDIRGIGSEDKKNAWIAGYKEKDRQCLFNLGKDPLMRVAVLQTGETDYELIWSFHHILLDGWAIEIISAEFLTIYRSYQENRHHQLPPAKPYRAYIQWLAAQGTERSKQYWTTYLLGYNEKTEIPGMDGVNVDKRNTGEQENKREKMEFTLEHENTHRLGQLAREHRVTMSTLVQTVWAIVLGHYSGKRQADVVFGYVVSGRPPEIEGVESMVGVFINTIPVRIQYEETTRFSDLLTIVQQGVIESEPHHYYPLAQIQATSALKQDLFDHILTFQNFPVEVQLDGVMKQQQARQGDFPLEISNVEAFVQTHYHLDLTITPGESLSVILRYNANAYKEELIKKVGQHFHQLLKLVMDKIDRPIKEFKLSFDKKKSKMLDQFMEEF